LTISTVEVGQSAILTLTLYQDGTVTDLGTVTLGVVDANGDEVVASGTAVTDGSNGTYTYTLSKRTEPQFLINTWTVSGGPTFTTYTDVQGSTLFNEAALRAFDDGAISAAAYTDDAVAKMHQRVVEYMESYTGRSWIRRYNRLVVGGGGSRILDLSQGVARTSSGLFLNRPGGGHDTIQILSATDSEGSVSTASIVLQPGGLLHRTDSVWPSATVDDPLNCVVEYEYGQPYPVDGADRVAMLIAKHWLVSSRVPDVASSFNDALGTYTFDESRLPWEAYSWLRNHKLSGFFA
jgi:hypothetical protein